MQGRNAIVTGASRGIGTYIARALAAQGVNLLLVARSEPELARLTTQLRSDTIEVSYVAVDLADSSAPEQIAAAASARLSSVDILVNNAAIELQRRFHTIGLDEIDTVVRVDLVAPIALARLVLPQMLSQGYGRIVNISSIAGHVGFPFTEAYAASKDGLIGFSRVLRADYGKQGVTSSAIILGAVKEAGIGQRTIDELGLKTSTSYMVSPEKVANAVVRAIKKDKAETVVMPGPGRVMKSLMDFFPGFGPAMTRMSGAERTIGEVADHREAERAEAAAGHARAAAASRSRSSTSGSRG